MTKRTSKNKGYYYVCNNCLDFSKYNTYQPNYSYETVKDGKLAYIIDFHFSEKSTFKDFDILRDEYKWNIIFNKDKKIYLKSCLYTSKNSMPKAWDSLDELVNINNWNNENDYYTPCSVYVGKIDEQFCDIMEKNYLKIFQPIYDVLLNYDNATERIFGAIPDETLTTKEDLRNFFVDVHDNYIVFNFCRYRNANQYMECIKMIEVICEKISRWFEKDFSRREIDTSRYNNIDDYLDHRIEMLSNVVERKISSYEKLDDAYEVLIEFDPGLKIGENIANLI